MAKKPVQPNEVWEAVLKDPEFAAQPPAMKEALRPFVEATPRVLADVLDHPATLESLMKAKMAFLRYCLDNGFIEEAVKATPKATREMFDGMEDTLKQLLDGALKAVQEVLQDVPAFLANYEITERDVLTNPKVNLKGKALSLYDQGKLTVGDVLRLQPVIIIKNA